MDQFESFLLTQFWARHEKTSLVPGSHFFEEARWLAARTLVKRETPVGCMTKASWEI